jgi:Uncharacterized lipoprotein/Lipopolysaccharide-assembly
MSPKSWKGECMKIRFFVVVAISVFFLTGCAVFNAKPNLRYSTIIPRSDSMGDNIYVSDFKDSRADKDKGIIGEISNGYGIKCGEIEEPSNITAWVTSALKSELKNAGYEVADSKKNIVLNGEILSLSASNFYSYQATIYLKVNVVKNGAVMIDKTYKGDSNKLDILQFSYSRGIEEALTTSLQQVIKQVIEDIDKKGGSV